MRGRRGQVFDLVKKAYGKMRGKGLTGHGIDGII